MDCGGFLVQGSRPPSAMSSHRASSSHSKHHGYHTVSRTSFTDESLFGSMHQSKLNEPLDERFKAPWEYPKPLAPGHTYSSVRHFKAVLASNKKKPKDPPLLWCPTGPSKFVKEKKETKSNSSDIDWNTRTQFRHLKHTPTFVDESLFGKRLEEPTFEAPWNNNSKKEGSVKYSKPYLWDPSGDSRIQNHNGVEIHIEGRPPSQRRRPKTAIGINHSHDKESSHLKPVWKP